MICFRCGLPAPLVYLVQFIPFIYIYAIQKKKRCGLPQLAATKCRDYNHI